MPKGTHEIKCDYCGTEGIRVIRPIAIGNRVKREGASHDDQQRFQNLVTVLSKSMLAGNYREAYDYCNKVLEIDPASAAIWENKAICAYWKATSDGLIDEAEAREIATYLDAASDLDPHSATLQETRVNIAYMIYARARIWISAARPDLEDNVFSYQFVQQGILRYIKFYIVSFSISNDIEYLKRAVLELTDGIGTTGLTWSAYEAYVPTAKMRDTHIATIKRLDPSYAPPTPPPKKSYCFIATACYGDYEHPIVVELRRFRDEILTPTQIGRLFVDWYYRWSPHLASRIAKSGSLKALSLTLIVLPVLLVSRTASKVSRAIKPL